MTTTTVNKWGSQYGVRFSKGFLSSLDIGDKTRLDVTVEGDKIILSRSKKQKPLTLEKLFENWNEPYELTDEEKEWVNMEPAGRERFWEEE
ncbi:MAG: AbrB/MazE/SpoVT family DNA-binding domain-containing protein [Oscillospiraceae bacterium]|jgi:antitoxin component of MazEF toxin-antitoxin module|nr:AbrB/MazE/SpoVT family DNA-binding domain-containing protein [Oscillospiraceae bacterium]